MSRIDDYIFNQCPKCGHMLMPWNGICPFCKTDKYEIQNVTPEQSKTLLVFLMLIMAIVGIVFLVVKVFF